METNRRMRHLPACDRNEELPLRQGRVTGDVQTPVQESVQDRSLSLQICTEFQVPFLPKQWAVLS